MCICANINLKIPKDVIKHEKENKEMANIRIRIVVILEVEEARI